MKKLITYKKNQSGSYIIIFENGVKIGDLIQDNDGFYKFFINLDRASGYLTETILFSIANKMKQLNKKWNQEINYYFHKYLRK